MQYDTLLITCKNDNEYNEYKEADMIAKVGCKNRNIDH